MRPLDETETDDEVCVVFSSEAAAEAARQRLALQPGFRDFPTDFAIGTYLVDEVQWGEGFVSLGPDD